MRKLFLALFAAGGIATFNAPAAMAMPTVGDVLSSAVESPVTEARVFCYNRYTGRFLHWGYCGGGYYRPYWRRRYYYRRRYWRRRYYY
jgi:hypothetical protein